MQIKYIIIIFLLAILPLISINIPESKAQVNENHYLRDRPNGFCGVATQEQLIKAVGGGDVTNTILVSPDISHSENITATLAPQIGSEWFGSLHIELPTGGGPANTVRILVTRQNISCSTTYQFIDETRTITKGTTAQYAFINSTAQPEILFSLGDSLVIEIFRVAGNQVPILHYNSTTNNSLLSTTTESIVGNFPAEVRTIQAYTLNTPIGNSNPRFENLACAINFNVGCLSGSSGRDTIFQDIEIRFNVTVRDTDGIINLTSIHVNFNSTNTINITISWFNDPNASPDRFLANTTNPTIIENLRMENRTSGNLHNITLIFSFSDEFGQGFHTLWDVNASDGTSSDVNLQIEKWLMFFLTPSTGGGGVSALSLAPIGPQIMLAFILVGLLALGQSNPWFVLGGWVSMAIAFGMSLTGQIYIGLGSTDNLLTFSQAFPEDFSIWIFRFFIIMQFVYPIRIFVLVYERLITIISSLRTRLG